MKLSPSFYRQWKTIWIMFLVHLLTTHLLAQKDSSWSVLLLSKGHELEMKKDMASFSKSGFYLYRNCIYEIETKTGEQFSGRLVDVQQDSLSFTNYFNANTALKSRSHLDTLQFHYGQLEKLKLIADRAMAI